MVKPSSVCQLLMKKHTNVVPVYRAHRAAFPGFQRERALLVVPLPQLRPHQVMEVQLLADHLYSEPA